MDNIKIVYDILVKHYPYYNSLVGEEKETFNNAVKVYMEMLNKAAELKENDGYIIDSLGWAYYAN